MLLVAGRGFERRQRSEQYFCGVEWVFWEGWGLRGAEGGGLVVVRDMMGDGGWGMRGGRGGRVGGDGFVFFTIKEMNGILGVKGV